MPQLQILPRDTAVLAEAGHEVEEGRQLWGARRAFAITPGEHRVELMEFAPPVGR